jgi:hypothetical protein
MRPGREHDEVSLRPFDEPEGAPPIPVTQLHPGEQRWAVCRDLIHNHSTLEVINDLGVRRFDNIDLEVTKRAVERYSCTDDDLSSVCGETRWAMNFARGDWQVQTSTHTILTSTPTDFHLHARLDAYEGARRVHSANWQRVIPRDLV